MPKKVIPMSRAPLSATSSPLTPFEIFDIATLAAVGRVFQTRELARRNASAKGSRRYFDAELGTLDADRLAIDLQGWGHEEATTAALALELWGHECHGLSITFTVTSCLTLPPDTLQLCLEALRIRGEILAEA